MIKKMFEIKQEVSEDYVKETFDAAMNGSDYWSDEIKVDNKKVTTRTLLQSLLTGNSLSIHDSEEDKWVNFDLNNFLTGISKSGVVDEMDIDYAYGDVVLQYAVFGELVYG